MKVGENEGFKPLKSPCPSQHYADSGASPRRLARVSATNAEQSSNRLGGCRVRVDSGLDDFLINGGGCYNFVGV